MTIDVRAVRLTTGMTQKAFADAFRLPIGNVRDWEQGRSAPDRAAIVYLRMIQTDARAVADILARMD